MDFVQRVLIREEIDSLERDLSRARERDPSAVPVIRADIERLEQLLHRRETNGVQRGP